MPPTLFYTELIHCKKRNKSISFGRSRYRLSFHRIVKNNATCWSKLEKMSWRQFWCIMGLILVNFWMLFGILLGTLLAPLNTPGNPRNSGDTLCPTFSRFWGAKGGLQGAPVGPNRGAKFFKMLQEEPTKAPMWPQMRLFRSHWSFFEEPNC